MNNRYFRQGVCNRKLEGDVRAIHELPLHEPVHLRFKSEQFPDKYTRRTIHEEITGYSSAIAGTSDDLDESLETASLEHLATFQ